MTCAPLSSEPLAAILIHLVDEAATLPLLTRLGPSALAQAALQGFEGKPGQALVIVNGDGMAFAVAAGARFGASGVEPGVMRSLAAQLPPGDYALADLPLTEVTATAWAIGGYGFHRYKAGPGKTPPRLCCDPAGMDIARALRVAQGCALARDMVNTPANDMGPAEIEALARDLAQAHGATVEATLGDALLAAGYPAIHAVGRAAAPHRAPRLIEIGWRAQGAAPDAPHVVLIGKGVVFDTGGLDIKPSSGMRNMKKDMGGAAHALALARLVMEERLAVRLTLLLPIAENAISGDAMRPGDVLASRKGVSIEVGNTDAEGRLILADALTRAGELDPDLTLDLATLTGAARVALGPDVPPFYTASDTLAAELAAAALAADDPLWRMPLWAAYDSALDSDVADLKNDADLWAQAGSITAALFLQRFAPTRGEWMHLDIFAWNPRKRPGWPVGGEAQSIRALFQLLRTRYGPAEPAS